MWRQQLLHWFFIHWKNWFTVKVIFLILPVFYFFFCWNSQLVGLVVTPVSAWKVTTLKFVIIKSVVKPPCEVCIAVSASPCCLNTKQHISFNVCFLWLKLDFTIKNNLLTTASVDNRNLGFNQCFPYIKLCLIWTEVFASERRIVKVRLFSNP